MPSKYYSPPKPEPADRNICWQCGSKDLDIETTPKGARRECPGCGCVSLFKYPLTIPGSHDCNGSMVKLNKDILRPLVPVQIMIAPELRDALKVGLIFSSAHSTMRPWLERHIRNDFGKFVKKGCKA